MSSFDASTHKLAGSNPTEAGGLILKTSKSRQNSEGGKEGDVFKKPSTSRLGLDRLARRKREEREAEAAMAFPEKKARLQARAEGSAGDSNARISFGRSSRTQDAGKERKYRGTLVETPSYTGGVSEDALQKIHSRLVGREQRSQGVYASSSRNKDRWGTRQGREERLCEMHWSMWCNTVETSTE